MIFLSQVFLPMKILFKSLRAVRLDTFILLLSGNIKPGKYGQLFIVFLWQMIDSSNSLKFIKKKSKYYENVLSQKVHCWGVGA